MDYDKQRIIDLFRRNVKGRSVNLDGYNTRHDGRGGHWLERQFGIQANANNSSDLFGYELKNQTSSKTTFGDWSANRYIFKDGELSNFFKGSSAHEKQDDFCKVFGKSNQDKGGRYSWSGSPCPKIDTFNDFGQTLIIEENSDIVAIYSYSKDRRSDRDIYVPSQLRVDNLEIARWFGKKSPSSSQKDKCLKSKLEDKFNVKGWFTCKTNINGIYSEICFGDPIDFDQWIELVQKGLVFFDSGMYQGNKRPYSQWRAQNSIWESLITERYS